MSTYILTSMFPNGFHAQAAEVFQQKIAKELSREYTVRLLDFRI